MKTIPNYHPPQDYRRPTKTQEKVYVPVNDYPEINFSMIANPLTLLTNLSPIPPNVPLSLCVFSRPDWNTTRYLALAPPCTAVLRFVTGLMPKNGLSTTHCLLYLILSETNT